MMKATVAAAIVGVAVILVAAPAQAHHSMIAEFSQQKPVTLKGTITKLMWTNPHGWVHLDVKGPDGRIEKWEVETGSPLRMTKRGLKKTYFTIGCQVIIGGYAARDGERRAAGTIVFFPDREAAGKEASFALGR